MEIIWFLAMLILSPQLDCSLMILISTQKNNVNLFPFPLAALDIKVIGE